MAPPGSGEFSTVSAAPQDSLAVFPLFFERIDEAGYTGRVEP